MTNTDLPHYAGAKIKALRDRDGYTQDELAAKLHVKKSAVSNYETGFRMPKQDVLFALSQVFNVSVDTFFPNTRDEELPIHSYPYIPAAISAGSPATVDAITPDELEQVAIPDAVMGKWAGHSDISLMRANGDSMNRVIPNGSLIGVRKIDEISDLKNGDIVVFDCDGEYAVKRFFNDKQNRTYIFQPDSDRDGFFPVTHSYDDEDLVAIVGKVVMYVVELS